MASIGLSMIVKNGGEDLRRCLESVRGVVSQIVIADTGSGDNSREIAAEYGATVIPAPWKDNFSAARNAALEFVTTDWVLALDADEELAKDAAEAIRSLLSKSDGIGGYLVPVRNYYRERHVYLYGTLSTANHDPVERARDAASHAEHRVCRLFRRHPEIFYTGRVHEVVEHRIAALGMRLEPANFRILHFGYLAGGEVRAKKNHFYRGLCRLKVREEPDNPLGWYELGAIEFVRFHNQEEALRCLEKATRLAPRLVAAWWMISLIYGDRGEPELSLRALGKAETSGEKTFFVYHRKGELLSQLGRIKEAQGSYRKALQKCQHDADSPEFTSRFAVESKLGYLEVKLGRHRAGLYKLRHAVEHAPMVLENHDRLMKGYILAGDLPAAADAMENTLKYFYGVKIFLRAAALRAQLGDREKERSLLVSGLRFFPKSSALQQSYRQLMQRCPANEAAKEESPYPSN